MFKTISRSLLEWIKTIRTTKLFFCKYQIFIHYLGVFQFWQPKQFILFYSRHLDMTVDTGFGDGDLDLEHAIQKCQPRHDKGTTCGGSKFGTWRDTKGNNPKNDKFIGNQIARDCSSPIWTVVKAETCRRCCARDSPRKTPEIGLPELQFQLVSAVKFDDFFFRMQQCFVSLFQGQQLKSILIEDS